MIDLASANYIVESAPKVLVLSDVHGHCGLSRALAVARREAPVSALVLLGDFCEPKGRTDEACPEWRRALMKVTRESKANYVIYIEGNHDSNATRCLEGLARVISDSYLLPASDNAYFLTHGHLYERKWLEECLWSKGFTTPESDECVLEWGRRIRRTLRLPGSIWLVLGHTHRLMVDSTARIIHAGALCERVLSRLSIDWRRSLGYIIIRDQWVELRRIDPSGRLVSSVHTLPISSFRSSKIGFMRRALGRLLTRLRERP